MVVLSYWIVGKEDIFGLCEGEEKLKVLVYYIVFGIRVGIIYLEILLRRGGSSKKGFLGVVEKVRMFDLK